LNSLGSLRPAGERQPALLGQAPPRRPALAGLPLGCAGSLER